MNNLTITQLEYVIAVDTHRNFAKAAAHCFITQPTLSMQIKKLEDQLGILIFDRSKKPVLPTSIGGKIIDQARSSLNSLGKIQDIIEDSQGSISGELRIGIIPTLAPYLLPRFVNSFVTNFPQIKLILEEQLSDLILDNLSKDLLDVAIMVAPQNHQKVQVIPLFQEEFVGYFSLDHPLFEKNDMRLWDLDTSDMWLLKEGHCFRDQVEHLCGNNHLKQHDRSILLESGSLETLKNIVDQQLGFTLLPELASINWTSEQKRRLKRFKGEKPAREVSLVMHRSFMKQRLIEVLRREIVNCLPAEVARHEAKKIIQWNP